MIPTKECRLISIENKEEDLKTDGFVKYNTYTLHRTTEKAIGQIISIQNDSVLLSNGNMYSINELTPVKLVVICERDPLSNEPGLFVDTEYCQGLKKVVAQGSQIGFSRDTRHGDNMCHLCVPIAPMEINEILSNQGKCKIQTKEVDGKEVVKFVNGKITFIF